MKVTAVKDFYDLTAFVGRRAGEVIEVPEDRGARLIEMQLAKAEGAKVEKTETPESNAGGSAKSAAKGAAKTAAKRTAKKEPI